MQHTIALDNVYRPDSSYSFAVTTSRSVDGLLEQKKTGRTNKPTGSYPFVVTTSKSMSWRLKQKKEGKDK